MFAFSLMIGCVALRLAPTSIRPAEPSRIVALGDVHGDFERMQRAIRGAGLIDDNLHWAGGDTTLVQLGDILDRGDAERECWSLLQQLREEAPASGGQVVCLLGNHEIMNVMGVADPFIHASGRTAFGPDRTAAWAPGGELATALADCPVVAIIGDSAFVHAGLPCDTTAESIAQVNEQTREWLLGVRRGPPAVLQGGSSSPVWDRSLSSPSGAEPRAEDCAALRATLDRLGVARVVVGHTPQRQVNSACGGAVWRCDTGMSRWVVGGYCQALEITPANGVRVLRDLKPPAPVTATVAPEAECDDDGCTDIFRDYF